MAAASLLQRCVELDRREVAQGNLARGIGAGPEHVGEHEREKRAAPVQSRRPRVRRRRATRRSRRHARLTLERATVPPAPRNRNSVPQSGKQMDGSRGVL